MLHFLIKFRAKTNAERGKTKKRCKNSTNKAKIN